MLTWQDLGSPRRHDSGTPGRDCLDLANHRACLWRISWLDSWGGVSVGSSGAGASEWKGESKVKQAFICLCLIVDSVWLAAMTSLSLWTVLWSWSEHKNRHSHCWNRIESPEIHPHSYSHLVFDCQNILGKRATSSAHSAGETDSSQWKNEISLCMKIHSRWIRGLNEDFKLPDENVGKNTSKHIQELSTKTPTAQTIILRLDQQCYMKCRSCCTAKETIRRAEPATGWESIFTSYTSDRRATERIKNGKGTFLPVRARLMKGTGSSQKKNTASDKDLEQCSKSSASEKSSRNTSTKDINDRQSWQGCGERITYTLLMGL